MTAKIFGFIVACILTILAAFQLNAAQNTTVNDAPAVGYARQGVASGDTAALDSTAYTAFIIPTAGKQNVSLSVLSSSNTGTATIAIIKGMKVNGTFVPFARETSSSVTAASAYGILNRFAAPELQYKTSGATFIFVLVTATSATTDVLYSFW